MIGASGSIGTLADLRAHLQYAIGIELTTIPAYLCAMYSIEPGTNTAAYEVIQSVVLEEMLHMSLAANVLNAIGGIPSPQPVGNGPSPVPVYPTRVSFVEHTPTIALQPLSVAALDEFLKIELPTDLDASVTNPENYSSIGAFYAAIATGLCDLATPEVFDDARTTRAGCQLDTTHYYGGAGSLNEVVDLDSAIDAIERITREGEGVPQEALTARAATHMLTGAQTAGRLTHGYGVDDLDRLGFGWKMYSHYARFKEVRSGRRYLPTQIVEDEPAGDVLPVDLRAVRRMTVNPKAENFVGTWAHAPIVACNTAYTALVDVLYRGFNGDHQALAQATAIMYDLKYHADGLLNMTSPHDPNLVLGPGFEYTPNLQHLRP